MRVSGSSAITTPHGTPRVTVGTPPRAPRSVRGGRMVSVGPRAMAFVLVNALASIAAVIWLLPAPWGGAVPVLLLAQVAWYRHGFVAAALGLALGSSLGAGLGQLLGMGDWRRSAFALSLLLLPAMIAWPARADSARG